MTSAAESASSRAVDEEPGADDSPQMIDEIRGLDFVTYMTLVAQARYVMRKVLRILDECAKAYGLEALEHQALLQIAGMPSRAVPIHVLAARLDIVPAFGSRLVKQLESKGLITRSNLKADKRVTLTTATEDGVALLEKIAEKVHYEIAHFQRTLEPKDRASAMAIFAFYVGEPGDSAVSEAIRSELD
jgi:DNA-binding MarR family transcriptional regulator